MPEPAKAVVGTSIISSHGVGVSVGGNGVGTEGVEVEGGLDPQALRVPSTKTVKNTNLKVGFLIIKFLIRWVNWVISGYLIVQFHLY